jgi:hypothetical protein
VLLGRKGEGGGGAGGRERVRGRERERMGKRECSVRLTYEKNMLKGVKMA